MFAISVVLHNVYNEPRICQEHATRNNSVRRAGMRIRRTLADGLLHFAAFAALAALDVSLA